MFYRQRITKLHFKDEMFEIRVCSRNVSCYWLTAAKAKANNAAAKAKANDDDDEMCVF